MDYLKELFSVFNKSEFNNSIIKLIEKMLDYKFRVKKVDIKADKFNIILDKKNASYIMNGKIENNRFCLEICEEHYYTNNTLITEEYSEYDEDDILDKAVKINAIKPKEINKYENRQDYMIVDFQKELLTLGKYTIDEILEIEKQHPELLKTLFNSFVTFEIKRSNYAYFYKNVLAMDNNANKYKLQKEKYILLTNPDNINTAINEKRLATKLIENGEVIVQSETSKEDKKKFENIIISNFNEIIENNLELGYKSDGNLLSDREIIVYEKSLANEEKRQRNRDS